MMERERVLMQADQQMAQINRRDSMLRGRGTALGLTVDRMDLQILSKVRLAWPMKMTCS